MRILFSILPILLLGGCLLPEKNNKSEQAFQPKFRLVPSDTFYFRAFVDCNMAEAWIGDTFRIFPGKNGEDPVWGLAKELKYGDGKNADEVFRLPKEEFINPILPENARPGTPGVHGAFYFETIYQDAKDSSGKTLYALYHNENYPETLPYDSLSGEGYINKDWPGGLAGSLSPAAVCRIGIMRSSDGGHSWADRGIILEDLQPRMILKPHNNSVTFAGGVGDPSAVASGDYLYVFFSEYSYPGEYRSSTYNRDTEWEGQCISVARIALKDLDQPRAKAKRWDGKSFSIPWNGIGKPIRIFQIPKEEGGGPVTNSMDTTYNILDKFVQRIAYMAQKSFYGFSAGAFYWGPSVSWNTYLECWVMVMGKVIGPHFQGHQLYISFNPHKDLGVGDHSQDWTKPQLLFQKYGSCLWYPSLQPMNLEEDIREKRTCLKLGKRARFFMKHRYHENPNNFLSTHIIEFEK